MCVAVVGKVIELKETKALCSFDGILAEVSTVLFPAVKINDNVLVHSGFVSEIVKDTKKLFFEVVSTDSLSLQCLDAIKRENIKFDSKEIKIIIFEGPHKDVINKYGLEELLPKNIQFIYKECLNEAKLLDNLEFFFKEHNSNGVIFPKYVTDKINLQQSKKLCFKYKNHFVITQYEPIDILKSVLTILCNINIGCFYEK